MKLAVILIIALLATALALSTSTAVEASPRTPITERLGRRLNKRGRWAAEEHQKVRGDTTAELSAPDANARPRAPPSRKFESWGYKVCLMPGPCYMKKLVCPKWCTVGNGRLQTQHIIAGWGCILDCINCNSYC